MREASLVGTIRNEAEVIEALQKVISKAFTKKATGVTRLVLDYSRRSDTALTINIL